MHLHCGLGRAEVSPWKYRETQIDRCGVQSVDRVRKLQFKRLGSIQVPRSANQDLREISPDTPDCSIDTTRVAWNGVDVSTGCRFQSSSCALPRSSLRRHPSSWCQPFASQNTLCGPNFHFI